MPTKYMYYLGWMIMGIASLMSEPALGIVGFALAYYAWQVGE